jgi:hypothetical protein
MELLFFRAALVEELQKLWEIMEIFVIIGGLGIGEVKDNYCSRLLKKWEVFSFVF